MPRPGHCKNYGRGIVNKDERGDPDRRGYPDRTVQPRKNSGHGAVICLIRGTVRSGIQEMGLVGNWVVFSLCGYFFYSLGLNFDSSEMININIFIYFFIYLHIRLITSKI